MSSRTAKKVISLLCACLAAACQSPGTGNKPGQGAADAGTMPESCAASFPRRYALFGLPPTVAPAKERGSKGQPLQVSVAHPVNQALGDATAWRDVGNGWSTIGLRLVSDNARTLAVHLASVRLPPSAEIWLCSPDGSLRQGPLKANQNAEVYSPVVRGSEAWLEVITPTWSVDSANVTLVEVFGGFR